ncbi:UDP-3-O-acyl-N-acetylglucosamine deacetylase [bacterium]|nr:UDP-3-O-acyl-N-acetylglucosamine deacetylase [bacterium]
MSGGVSIGWQGVGIHTGQPCSVTVSPGRPGSGIVFEQMGHQLPAWAEYALPNARATLLTHQAARVLTPEHLLSALYGLGIYDAHVTVEGPELPILDGSALPYVTGLATFPRHVTEPWVVTTPLHYQDGQTQLSLYPGNPRWTVMIDYPDTFVGAQWVDWVASSDSYGEDIAPARTYGFESEVTALQAQGMALGGSLDNALVITHNGYLSPLRFHNELARHKCLDLIGDMALVGVPIQAHVVARFPSHQHNTAFARLIRTTWGLG